MPKSLRIRPAAAGIELEMPSGRWIYLPQDARFAARLTFILQANCVGAGTPTLTQPGNPTAEMIRKGADTVSVKRKLTKRQELEAWFNEVEGTQPARST